MLNLRLLSCLKMGGECTECCELSSLHTVHTALRQPRQQEEVVAKGHVIWDRNEDDRTTE